MLFPGLWELPTESLEEGETAEDALERVLFERLTVLPRALTSLGSVNFTFGDGGRILAYGVELCKNFIHIYGYDDFRWIKPRDLKHLRVLAPHVTILTQVVSAL